MNPRSPTLRAPSPIPLYHQIATVLIARINEGEYPSGSSLPTEEALQAEFNVSRATVRQAVMELVRAGLISRRRGIGSWVTPGVTPASQRRFRGSLADLMSERGAKIAYVDIKGANPSEVPRRVAALLGGEIRGVTIVRRRWEYQGRPFAFKVNYVVAPYGKRLTDRLLLKEPHLMRVLEGAGARIVKATQSIRAQVADQSIADSLDLSIGAPVLFVERVVFAEDDLPVELAQTWYRGDAYEYSILFDLSDGQAVDAHLA